MESEIGDNGSEETKADTVEPVGVCNCPHLKTQVKEEKDVRHDTKQPLQKFKTEVKNEKGRTFLCKR
jgi:hypothetical protein